MKRTVRKNVFETNSSTMHSIVIMSEKDEEKWENNLDLYIFTGYDWFWEKNEIKPEKGKIYSKKEIIDTFISKEELNNCESEEEIDEAIRWADFINYSSWTDQELEFDETHFVTPSGDHMVAMCAYGNDY